MILHTQPVGYRARILLYCCILAILFRDGKAISLRMAEIIVTKQPHRRDCPVHFPVDYSVSIIFLSYTHPVANVSERIFQSHNYSPETFPSIVWQAGVMIGRSSLSYHQLERPNS